MVGGDVRMSTPKSKKLEEISDPDNERALAHITNLMAFDGDELSKLFARGEGRFKLPFKVSCKEFDEWCSDKEEEIEEIGHENLGRADT